jgi:hypothetical protein
MLPYMPYAAPPATGGAPSAAAPGKSEPFLSSILPPKTKTDNPY